eukprot:SAG31_NODE_12843_length_912_cov_1.452645_1_plen_118_part_10
MLFREGVDVIEWVKLDGIQALTNWTVLTPDEAALWRADERRWASVQPHDTIHRAAETGDTVTIRRLLQGGVDVDRRREGNSLTPLMMAAKHGHLAAVNLLVDSKAELDAQSTGGWTAL